MAFQYAFIIIFIHACLQEGMIFGKIRWMLDEIIAYEWARKPLYDCVVCMSGLYTVILWFTKDGHKVDFEHWDWASWNFDLLWMVCIVGGIITVLAPLVDAAIFDFHRKRTSDE